MGGAQAGEPTSLGFLDGVIIERTPGDNFLRVNNNSGLTSARTLSWDFLHDAEITSGTVQVSFRFTPLALDRYNLGVRESGSSSKSFVDVLFTSSGAIFVSDAAGSIPMTNTYVANTELAVVIDFDMDARTSKMTINGLPIFSGRAHGIVDRGVGRVITGYPSQSNFSSFELDDLVVSAVVPLPLVLDVDFDDKSLGDLIQTGGAREGEPVSINSYIDAKIVDLSAGNPALNLANTVGSSSHAVRWQFLDGLEVESGIVGLDVDLMFAVRDYYQILIRESASSTSNFGVIRFSIDGDIFVADANGPVNVPAVSYSAGQVYRLRMIYDVTAGTYSVLWDDTVLVADKAHGATNGRGVGAVLFGFTSSATEAAEFNIDALQVGASDAPYIPSKLNFLVEPLIGIINEPLLPALEVGVVNVYGELIQDGTLVEVGIETGPGSATISGNIEPTVAGTARFDSLQVDFPGIYRLGAKAARAQATSEVNINILALPDDVFEDGFELLDVQ